MAVSLCCYLSFGSFLASKITFIAVDKRMGGLVLDILLEYLFKISRRGFYLFKSTKWERVTATLTHAKVCDPGWGCPSVRVNYEFMADGSLIQGSDVVPFYTRWHARTYVESLTRGLHPVIRVNPQNPDETRFFERDQ